ncbi:hypothetical protein AIOL_001320 [Candidatus Rhodobacter oscarellae]|uniref:Uncharacterized protein n=2 Tax=Candidatus Rhodobacter oscarellae TaxID=1675527 RepID=A0A0J9GSA6_9RHOB|nr:hypothetical protein AIOL_001320 [Candidatus Rhodobacter lobularis]
MSEAIALARAEKILLPPANETNRLRLLAGLLPQASRLRCTILAADLAPILKVLDAADHKWLLSQGGSTSDGQPVDLELAQTQGQAAQADWLLDKPDWIKRYLALPEDAATPSTEGMAQYYEKAMEYVLIPR